MKTCPRRDLWPLGLREARGPLPCTKPNALERDERVGGKLTVGLEERCVSYMHGHAWHGAGGALIWFSMLMDGFLEDALLKHIALDYSLKGFCG